MKTDLSTRVVRIILSVMVAFGLLAAAVRPSLVYGGAHQADSPVGSSWSHR